MIKFIRRTKNQLLVNDATPGVATSGMLAKRGCVVKVKLPTRSGGELPESHLETFVALLESYGRLAGRHTELEDLTRFW